MLPFTSGLPSGLSQLRFPYHYPVCICRIPECTLPRYASFQAFEAVQVWSPWTFQEHYAVSKRRTPVTQWRGVLSQRNGEFSSRMTFVDSLCCITNWKDCARESLSLELRHHARICLNRLRNPTGKRVSVTKASQMIHVFVNNVIVWRPQFSVWLTAYIVADRKRLESDSSGWNHWNM